MSRSPPNPRASNPTKAERQGRRARPVSLLLVALLLVPLFLQPFEALAGAGAQTVPETVVIQQTTQPAPAAAGGGPGGWLVWPPPTKEPAPRPRTGLGAGGGDAGPFSGLSSEEAAEILLQKNREIARLHRENARAGWAGQVLDDLEAKCAAPAGAAGDGDDAGHPPPSGAYSKIDDRTCAFLKTEIARRAAAKAADEQEQLPLQQQTELQQDRLEADPQTSAPKTGRLADLQAELETKKWPTGENDKAINDRNKTIATIPRGGVDASLPAEIFAGIGHGGHHTMPTSALAAAEEAMLFKGVASEAIIKLLLTANRERRRRGEEISDAALQTKDDGDAATQVEARRRESTKRQREIFRESRTIQRLVGEKQVLDHIRAMRCPGAAPAVRSSDVNNDDDDIKNDKNDDNNGDDGDDDDNDIINDTENDHDNGKSVQAYYDVGKRASCSVLTAEIAKLAAMSGKGRRRLEACPTFLEASHADLQGRGGGLEDGVNYVEVSCDMDASSESSLTVGSGQTYKIAKHPNAAGEVKLDRKATQENKGRHFEVTTGGSLTVSGLTLTGGYAVSDACNVCARFCSIHGSWRSMIHFMSLFCFPIT